MERQKIKNLFLSTLRIVSLIIIILFVSIYAYNFYINSTITEEKITKTALSNSGLQELPKTPQEKVKAVKNLLNYTKKHIKHTDYKNKEPLPYFPFLKVDWFDHNPKWIYKTKYGSCEEHAVLFTKFSNSINITARFVSAPAQDHAWSEVKINNTWIQVDPSNNIYNQPKTYENQWNYNLSTVRWTKNEKTGYRTNQYTDTNNLTIKITKTSRKPDDVKILIYSNYLKKHVKGYNSKQLALKKETKNEKTNAILGDAILGDGNYTITAYQPLLPLGKASIIGWTTTKTTTLKENTTKQINLKINQDLTELTILPNTQKYLEIYSLLFAIGILSILIYNKYSKKPQKQK
ncbi:hypothetical protein C9439_03025 [archaeon SCG-AAA382B04]|nr:hypothetical protein C9439_03025 [archaeon SCG-AAA382B04]